LTTEDTPHGSVGAAPILSVITPTFNEAENIPILIERIHAALIGVPHEIVVADDNSPDGTWRAAEQIAAKDPSVVVLRRFHDHGLSAAVLDGMAAARGDFLAVIDADLQHDETRLPGMLAEAVGGRADVVVGSREVDAGGYGEWSSRRRAVSWVASAIAKVFLKVPTTDPMSGFFLLSRDTYETCAPDINPRGFKILLEFIGRRKDLRVVDVGYQFSNRMHGRTKLNRSVIRSYLLGVAELRLGRTINPIFLLYVLVGIMGVLVNSALFTLFEALDMPRLTTGVNDAVDPIYSSFLLSVSLTTLLLFAVNNEFTFWEQRFRGWKLAPAFVVYALMTLVGTIVHTAVFTWLQDTGTGFDLVGEPVATVIHNLVGALIALIVNWYLNSTYLWRRRQDR
jgi:dolichol-phosphate mannosyltransferase